MGKLRKPFGVWMLLADGQPWNYCNEATLADAIASARALRGPSPLFPQSPVWIAPPAKVGVKATL